MQCLHRIEHDPSLTMTNVVVTSACAEFQLARTFMIIVLTHGTLPPPKNRVFSDCTGWLRRHWNTNKLVSCGTGEKKGAARESMCKRWRQTNWLCAGGDEQLPSSTAQGLLEPNHTCSCLHFSRIGRTLFAIKILRINYMSQLSFTQHIEQFQLVCILVLWFCSWISTLNIRLLFYSIQMQQQLQSEWHTQWWSWTSGCSFLVVSSQSERLKIMCLKATFYFTLHII